MLKGRLDPALVMSSPDKSWTIDSLPPWQKGGPLLWLATH